MARGPADDVVGHRLLVSRQLGKLRIEEHSFSRPSSLEWHSHEVPVVVALLGGSYRQLTRRVDFMCCHGDLLVVPAEEQHSEQIGNSGACGLLIWNVDGDWSETLSSHTNPHLARVAHRIHYELHASDQFVGLNLEEQLDQLLGRLAVARRRPRSPIDSPWVYQVGEMLRAHSFENLSLSHLAESAGVSRSQLSRGFRAKFGCSVGEYVRMNRLERAAEQIRKTDAPLAEIALAHGFYDQSHFTRLFRKHFGRTPSRYRQGWTHS